MTRQEIISLVRRFVSDEQATGFTDERNLEDPWGTIELLNYLDRAVNTYCKRRADAGDVTLLKRMSVSNMTHLPTDFIKFAGNVPFEINIDHVEFYGYPSETAIPVKYFARLPYVTAYDDGEELEYRHDQAMSIAALAAIYALNKHEFNVSQDLTLLAMGGPEGGGGNAVTQ